MRETLRGDLMSDITTPRNHGRGSFLDQAERCSLGGPQAVGRSLELLKGNRLPIDKDGRANTNILEYPFKITIAKAKASVCDGPADRLRVRRPVNADAIAEVQSIRAEHFGHRARFRADRGHVER